MQKVTIKEWTKFIKLGIVGLLLVIVLVVSGEQLQGIDALVLGLIPYVIYQFYCLARWVLKQKK